MRRTVNPSRTREKGSVVAYLLMAVALIAALTAALTKGSHESAVTIQVQQHVKFLETDLQTIRSAINECILVYSDPVDINGDNLINTTDNPNAPFPLYGDLSSGGLGVPLSEIKCPGNQQAIFNNKAGKFFSLIGSSDYTIDYNNNGTEGIQIIILRNSASPVWDEAMSQVNAKLSTCSAEIETGAGCTNGCFEFWIKRPATSSSSEAGCP